jgi:hypothetical protein
MLGQAMAFQRLLFFISQPGVQKQLLISYPNHLMKSGQMY